ncbi:probable protein phosphatase 2C 77 [Oryza glaberrima]|uniref:probable protein phosphatase 2C 77 n=1 Tax=Oryza glaberrima TaxID=4538 RepID=UPI00224C2404|nr:probable protein phosphatase 2C 77 [Oryza glaberrima]
MLCGAEEIIICSFNAFNVGLAHEPGKELMSICSPKFTAGLSSPTAWGTAKNVHVESEKQQQQLVLAAPPPTPQVVVLLPAFKKNCTDQEQRAPVTSKAARVRPARLLIQPAPVVAARTGMDPFGEAETDVATTETEVKGEGFCLASRRGARHAMEDGYGVITHHKIEGNSQLAFYGVYDGHGGRAVVDFIAENLGKNVVVAAATATRSMGPHQDGSSSSPSQQLREENDAVAEEIRAAYQTLDRQIVSQRIRGGACAATVLLKDGELYASNVGDCRVVLGSRNGVATALTSDQTPGREDERLRIEKKGGYVSCGGSGVWRVQDSLAVSRAFGDACLKQWVTCEPETAHLRLTADDCRFLVLASDGLWCKVSNQEAVDAVAAAAAAGGVATSTDPCKELIAMARSRGSRDDITVMVVDLQRFLPVESPHVQ